MSVFKSVGEQAVASMDDETLEYLFKKQPYTKDMLDAFGISYGDKMRDEVMGAFKVKAPAKSDSGIPKYDPKTQKLQQNSKGEYRVVSK